MVRRHRAGPKADLSVLKDFVVLFGPTPIGRDQGRGMARGAIARRIDGRHRRVAHQFDAADLEHR